MSILLTGASGFVGNAILSTAYQRNLKILPIYRSARSENLRSDSVFVPVIDHSTDWSEALLGIDTLIHTAALTHIISKSLWDHLAEFRCVNVEGTLNLARQAAAAGVRRFIFISSIKVNGESTSQGCSFTADDAPAPQDAYGLSKAEAEAGLQQLSQETAMEVVIIRPPLVYGPGVKGNFSRLLRWVTLGLPIPLGLVTNNRRSLVALDNLVDLIFTCVNHPNAANQTFLVSDDEDLSTADLMRRIGESLNKPARLVSIPVSMLIIASRLFGKSSTAQRLLGSLQVDITKTCTVLNWKPQVSVDEGLRRAVLRGF
jgi:nucleoside-diphosphate-sugar epimerase